MAILCDNPSIEAMSVVFLISQDELALKGKSADIHFHCHIEIYHWLRFSLYRLSRHAHHEIDVEIRIFIGPGMSVLIKLRQFLIT
jgi:hypothetical protein